MSTIEGLLDADELREQIIERAAEKVVARWQPPKDEDRKRQFDDNLEGRVLKMFQATVQAELVKPVREAIEHALLEPFTPTDNYGEPRHRAEKQTMREVIEARVERELRLPENRPGYSSSRSETAISQWLEREVKSAVKKQLWADFQTIADEVTKAAAEAIQDSVKYLVANKTRR